MALDNLAARRAEDDSVRARAVRPQAISGPRFGPLVGASGTQFRLWAPSREAVSVVLAGREPLPLVRNEQGWWSTIVADAEVGTHYKFLINGRHLVPDPASRQQTTDSKGWSVVRAGLPPPARLKSTRRWHEAIISEVHVGTVTPEGTYSALAVKLPQFADAGFTFIELMPLNTFPGQRNWGYDGTLLFAPAPCYGTPEDLRALVDRAHALGLGMIIDVVYNHFGSVDNFLPDYAPEWFAADIETPWGPGIDFRRETVRAFYFENAAMWIRDYDFDGLRIDALHEIGTDERDKFLGDLAKTCRAIKPDAALVIENVRNHAHWLTRLPSGTPKDFSAQWNDDFRHVLSYLVTGEARRGYEDLSRDPIADLEKAVSDGFVHDGEIHDRRSDGRTRNEPASALPPEAFVVFAENHDMIGNRPDALRLTARLDAARLDFARFLVMMSPQIPLFFMGEAMGAQTPFPFFFDFDEKHADEKALDRYLQMPWLFGDPVPPGGLPDPQAMETFLSAKLDWATLAQPEHQSALARFRTLADWRQRMLWPLSASGSIKASSARQGNCFLVTRIYAAGSYTLLVSPTSEEGEVRARLGQHPVSAGQYAVKGERVTLDPYTALAWVG